VTCAAFLAPARSDPEVVVAQEEVLPLLLGHRAQVGQALELRFARGPGHCWNQLPARCHSRMISGNRRSAVVWSPIRTGHPVQQLMRKAVGEVRWAGASGPDPAHAPPRSARWTAWSACNRLVSGGMIVR
jgi:hypothetical protein